MLCLSLRARLASFPHAYAIALRRREHSGARQFVIRTGDPLQPVRVSTLPPADVDALVALVL